MERRRRVSVRVLVAAVALLVIGLPGVAAAAEQFFAGVTLWEVQEYLRLKSGSHSDNLMFRLANATLVGDATAGLCAPVGVETCAMDARATSTVSLSTGTGPITGAFNILLDSNPNSPLLSDLVLVATGTLHGTLDLRLVSLFVESTNTPGTPPPAGGPVAPAQGRWRSRELDARGSFIGGFLVPVPSAPFAAFGGPCATGFAYLNFAFSPVPGPVLPVDVAPMFQCLEPSDFSLGSPVTKFVGSLFAR